MTRPDGGWLSAAAVMVAMATGAQAGCSRKSEQCRAVVDAVNQGTARLSAFESERQRRPSAGPAQTAQDMRQLGAVYDVNARALDPAGLGEQELGLRASEYRATSENARDAARALASALDNQEHAGAAVAETSLARAVREQKATVAHINEFCAR